MVAAMYALTNMNFSFLVQFHKNQKTDPEVVLYSATIAMRFALPICYNYFTIFNGFEASAFKNAMGPIQSVVFLGSSFNLYFYPVCMSLIAFLTLFNVYNNVLRCLHLDQFSFGSGRACDLNEEVLTE